MWKVINSMPWNLLNSQSSAFSHNHSPDWPLVSDIIWDLLTCCSVLLNFMTFWGHHQFESDQSQFWNENLLLVQLLKGQSGRIRGRKCIRWPHLILLVTIYGSHVTKCCVLKTWLSRFRHTGGPWFESSHWQFFLHYQLYWKDDSKERRGR